MLTPALSLDLNGYLLVVVYPEHRIQAPEAQCLTQGIKTLGIAYGI